MVRNMTVAAVQMACSSSAENNADLAEKMVREAASRGGQIILLQELFETLYFCQVSSQNVTTYYLYIIVYTLFLLFVGAES
ncbi:hypothetical protein EON65_30405 [archaeon]|nr:MAG: hypothetical protein EON65_30405 [archaeon]